MAEDMVFRTASGPVISESVGTYVRTCICVIMSVVVYVDEWRCVKMGGEGKGVWEAEWVMECEKECVCVCVCVCLFVCACV